jgi:hypothetical protein
LTRQYFKLLLPIAFACLGLTLSARAWGGTQPLNPALVAFVEGCEEKPQPCWFGVVPGATTEAEIVELLAFAGEPEMLKSIFSRDFTLVYTLTQPWPYCRASFDLVRGVVIRGQIKPCGQPDIRVGDLAVLLANEEKILSLPPNEMVYGRVATNVEGWPSPYSRISYIDLLSPETPFQRFPWHGFVLQRRYCQLVPTFPRCDRPEPSG